MSYFTCPGAWPAAGAGGCGHPHLLLPCLLCREGSGKAALSWLAVYDCPSLKCTHVPLCSVEMSLSVVYNCASMQDTEGHNCTHWVGGEWRAVELPKQKLFKLLLKRKEIFL